MAMHRAAHAHPGHCHVDRGSASRSRRNRNAAGKSRNRRQGSKHRHQRNTDDLDDLFHSLKKNYTPGITVPLLRITQTAIKFNRRLSAQFCRFLPTWTYNG
jgi:hypothetical protein